MERPAEAPRREIKALPFHYVCSFSCARFFWQYALFKLALALHQCLTTWDGFAPKKLVTFKRIKFVKVMSHQQSLCKREHATTQVVYMRG